LDDSYQVPAGVRGEPSETGIDDEVWFGFGGDSTTDGIDLPGIGGSSTTGDDIDDGGELTGFGEDVEIDDDGVYAPPGLSAAITNANPNGYAAFSAALPGNDDGGLQTYATAAPETFNVGYHGAAPIPIDGPLIPAGFPPAAQAATRELWNVSVAVVWR
jgi:hypothetical protein